MNLPTGGVRISPGVAPVKFPLFSSSTACSQLEMHLEYIDYSTGVISYITERASELARRLVSPADFTATIEQIPSRSITSTNGINESPHLVRQKEKIVLPKVISREGSCCSLAKRIPLLAMTTQMGGAYLVSAVNLSDWVHHKTFFEAPYAGHLLTC